LIKVNAVSSRSDDFEDGLREKKKETAALHTDDGLHIKTSIASQHAKS
jgi:hypothetical protein